MKYEKPALSFEEQADLLLKRDLYRSKDRKMAAVLHLCRHWLSKADAGHSWHQRVAAHFATFPDIDLAQMGLSPDWQTRPLWTLSA